MCNPRSNLGVSKDDVAVRNPKLPETSITQTEAISGKAVCRYSEYSEGYKYISNVSSAVSTISTTCEFL